MYKGTEYITPEHGALIVGGHDDKVARLATLAGQPEETELLLLSQWHEPVRAPLVLGTEAARSADAAAEAALMASATTFVKVRARRLAPPRAASRRHAPPSTPRPVRAGPSLTPSLRLRVVALGP